MELTDISNKRHQTFVNQMVIHGDQFKAYQAAYPKCKESTARTESYKLLKNPQIALLIKEYADKLRVQAESKAVDELKDRIVADTLTSEAKRNILFQIASGTYETEKVMLKDGAFVRIKVKPDHIEVLKAIDIDNKMVGDYAPDKVAQTDTEGNDLTDYSNMSVEELQTLKSIHDKHATKH